MNHCPACGNDIDCEWEYSKTGCDGTQFDLECPHCSTALLITVETVLAFTVQREQKATSEI